MRQDGAARSRWPRILTYFLAAMVMLTLLSRAADAIMLPVVQCARPLPGALTHTAELSGTIEAREQLPVMTVAAVPVARVHVRAGQSVKAGDALLSYDQSALESALSTAELALKQLRTDREKAAGSATGDPDEDGVRTAELALARAQEDLQAKADSQDRTVRLAAAEVAEAQAALDSARTDAETAFAEAYAKRLKTAQEAYTAAEQELYTARVALDWEKNKLTDKAKKKYIEMQAAVDRAQKRSDAAQIALTDAQLAAHRASESGDQQKAQRLLEAAQSEANSAAAALDKAQIKRDRIPGAQAYTTKRLALEAVQITYDKARQEWSDAENRADAVVREIEQTSEAKRAAVETAAAALALKENALEAAELARDAALRDAQRALENAAAALDKEKERTLKALILDVQLKDEAIAEKENEVETLRQAAKDKGEVRAPVDGTVAELTVKPGETPSGAALRLSPASSGLVVRAAVTEDQAKYLALGMEARFKRSGDARADEGQAVLVGLSPTATGYEASFDLPEGAGAIGQAVNITASQSTETYGMRVPVSAIAASGRATGVYRVRIGQSVLGDMEYAEFVLATVTESDGQYAAISATLSDRDQVIVSSSKPISAGDRVRSAS